MDYMDWFYFKRKVKAPIYWFMHRFVKKHKYNIIYTGLKPGYWDCDTRVLYGVFKPFEEYMEFQLSPDSHVKWFFTDEEIAKELEDVYPEERENHEKWFHEKNAIWAELLRIYFWWKTYPALVEACWEEGHPDPIAREEELYNETNEKMKRIIELRSYLWD